MREDEDAWVEFNILRLSIHDNPLMSSLHGCPRERETGSPRVIIWRSCLEMLIGWNVDDPGLCKFRLMT